MNDLKPAPGKSIPASDNGVVIPSVSASPIESIEERIAPLRAQLANHPLYEAIQTAAHVRTFMELHVFAVWDFMSLLTALRQNLTCVSIPWRPTQFAESRRFINEIVLGEESDTFHGRSLSHFEIYLEAMEECGADTRAIRNLMAEVECGAPGSPIATLMARAGVPEGGRQFVQSTFDVIASGNVAAMAAAFTFGREDLIPEMFRRLVRDTDQRGAGEFGKLVWYLERHIEVDGDEHGPLSLRMVAGLCGADETRLKQAAEAAEKAIASRLMLWDSILALLEQNGDSTYRKHQS